MVNGEWSFMVHGSRLMVKGHLWFMIHGEWSFMVNGHLWLMVKGS